MSTVCQYCLMSVLSHDIVSHISAHFNHDQLSSDYCLLCDKPVNIDTTESIIDHMIQDHKGDLHCPICLKLTKNLDHMFYHLKANTNVVYHCKNLKCFLITSSLAELKQHASSFKHKKGDIYNEYNICCKLQDVMLSLDYEELKMFNHTLKKKNFKNEAIECPEECDIIDRKEIIKGKRKITKKTFFDDYELFEDSLESSSKLTNKSATVIESCTILRTFQMEYSDIVLEKLFKKEQKKLYYNLISKIKRLRLYSIGLCHYKGVKAFVCMTCNYLSQYCHTDVQRHILTTHFSLEISEMKLLMEATEFNTDLQVCADQEMIANISQRQKIKNDVKLLLDYKDKISDNSLSKSLQSRKILKIQQIDGEFASEESQDIKMIFKIEYSERVHRKCTKELNDYERKELSEKLKNCKMYAVGVEERSQVRHFVCMECQYSSPHSYSNLMKHILTKHCNVHIGYISDFGRASRRDSLHRLLSDKEMIKSINYERASKNNWDLLSDSEHDVND